MPSTTPKGVHYPLSTEVPNGPSQMGTLASDVDSLLDTRDALLGVTSAASDGSGTKVRSGKSIIATSETRSNTAYGLLTTPDRVQSVVMPTDGLFMIGYHATWQESVSGAARAAIFIGSAQLKIVVGAGTAPESAATGSSPAAFDRTLMSAPFGLVCASLNVSADYAGDVTTGMALGATAGTGGAYAYEYGNTPTVDSTNPSRPVGGPCYVFAAAGTYDVSVQFKASSGSVTVKNRRLWVRAVSF